jgi:hypothetical protein
VRGGAGLGVSLSRLVTPGHQHKCTKELFKLGTEVIPAEQIGLTPLQTQLPEEFVRKLACKLSNFFKQLNMKFLVPHKFHVTG